MSNQEASRSLQRMVLADTRATKPALPELGSRPFSPTALAELRKAINRKLREARREMLDELNDGGEIYGLKWAEAALVDLRKQVNRILTARAVGENG